MHFFLCNFDGRKIHVISKYFVDVISMVEKSMLFPRTFLDVISLVEMLFLLTFFDVILMGKNSKSFLANKNKTFEEVFLCL